MRIIFKKTLRTLSLSLGMLIGMIVSNSVYSESVLPGQGCQPANLTQALNFGLGWDQAGVRNTSPLGGGSFFVVCPVIHDDDDDAVGSIEIELRALQDGTIPITCTLYEMDLNDDTPISGVESATNFPFLGVPAGGVFPKGREVSMDLSAVLVGYAEANDFLSVVCAMHPQTQIGAFRFEGI